ncbi:hypothetical protein SAMN06266787_1039 [Halorubrum ezzemoulense]|uniref:Uncharacterized protein n=1 Tax=Halorubrum ezzemoulense TaxID=337243 RepID=A0A238X165_HALEZ|nr:hypothetical protein SAMN06266787_1039 [Halorubrum ezzemoulense]
MTHPTTALSLRARPSSDPLVPDANDDRDTPQPRRQHRRLGRLPTRRHAPHTRLTHPRSSRTRRLAPSLGTADSWLPTGDATDTTCRDPQAPDTRAVNRPPVPARAVRVTHVCERQLDTTFTSGVSVAFTRQHQQRRLTAAPDKSGAVTGGIHCVPCGGLSSWVPVSATPRSSACWPTVDRVIAWTGLANPVLVSSRFRTQTCPVCETDAAVSGRMAPFVRAHPRPFSTAGPAAGDRLPPVPYRRTNRILMEDQLFPTVGSAVSHRRTHRFPIQDSPFSIAGLSVFRHRTHWFPPQNSLVPTAGLTVSQRRTHWFPPQDSPFPNAGQTISQRKTPCFLPQDKRSPNAGQTIP